jgi:hypothetical protein
VSLAGCGLAAPTGGAENPGASRSWVTFNPVTLDAVADPANRQDERVTVERAWARVSGLADGAAEQMVNDRLREKYLEIVESGLPPYRGVKARIPEGAVMFRDQMHCEVSANFNNVLSVCYVRNRNYALPDENGRTWDDENGFYLQTQSVSECFPMTFDLAAGEELSLADMFTGGGDLKLLDGVLLAKLRAVGDDSDYSQMLLRYPVPVSLAGEYEPISAGQKFYISHDAALHLVIDYETPQFNIEGLYYCVFPLQEESLSSRMTLFSRFPLPEAEQAALYTAAPPFERALLPMVADDPASCGSLPPYRREIYEGVHVDVEANVSCEIPEGIEAQVAETLAPNPAELEILREIRAAGGTGECGGGIVVNMMRYGRFLTAMRSFYAQASADGLELHRQSIETRNWDADSLAEITLSDIFAEGFDFKGLLREALEEELERIGGLYGDGAPLGGASADAEKERLAEGMAANGASIEGTSMSFFTPPAQTAYSGGNRTIAITVTIPYKDIGYENLRLFD